MGMTSDLYGIRGGRAIIGALFALLCLALVPIILIDPDSSIALVLAMVVAFFIVKRPVVGILLVIVTTSTIISPSVLPVIRIFGADIEFTEILIILLTIVTFLKVGSAKAIKTLFSSPVTIPLFLFFALVVVSIFYSFSSYRNLETTEILARSRNLFYYLLFFPAVLTMGNEKDLRFLVKGLLVIAALVSLYFIYTAVFGITYLHVLFQTGVMPGAGITSVDTGSLSNRMLFNARISGIPGTSLIVTMFFVAVTLFIYHYSTGGAIWFGSLSALFAIPILLTFTRTTWATTLFIFPVLWLLIRKRRIRLTKLAFIMGGGFLAVFLAFSLHPKYSEIIGFTVDRFRSFFEENVETQTAVMRIVEMKAAMEEIEKNPMMGIGVAGMITNKTIKYHGREFVLMDSSSHNAFVALALKMGIPAVVIFLAVYLFSLHGAGRVFRRSPEPYIKALSLGLFLGLLRSFLNAFSQPYFIEIHMIPCLAISFAIVEVLRQRSRREFERKVVAPGRELALSTKSYPMPS